jgi:mannose-1-phosphate guanylyltransferase
MVQEHFGLIMAGGQGTRFWPYSTETRPKQFLNIIGNDSLIRQTYQRLERFIKRENIFIVADKKYLGQVLESIPGFPRANFIEEPCPRNTAPCLILANIFLSRLAEDANLLVVPADHYIPDTDIFAGQLLDALSFAGQQCIVTCGIKPHLPHTGYGYIRFDRKASERLHQTEFFTVHTFKEKPELAVAREYLQAGNYYWNSGMFVYNLQHFKAFLRQYAPYYYEKYLELEGTFDSKPQFREIFSGIKPDSIDYALMEKVKEVRMFAAAFSWSDVGSWSSVYELNPKDAQHNVNIRGNCLIDTGDSLVFSTEDTPIAVIGLKNVAVIHTAEGILVAHLNEVQKVKQVHELLKR